MGDLKPTNTNKAVSTQTITLTAVPENFAAAQEHVRSFLDSASCSMRTLFELDMVVEEVFINVASYAYPDSTGMVSLDLTLDEEQNFLCLTFRDSGIPYDPLRKQSPDLSAPAEKRPIGGLGIFLVQKYSDSLSYEYADGENRLTIGKKLD
jgi:anti-sigma regulatory factor (Ser/Thr protein kinase)